ncbi:MAG: nucleotidyltransferase domain-containing protein [Lautropia sp.]
MQTSRPQSYFRFPLTQLLASGGHVRVLRALTSYGAPLSVTQIATDCGLSPRGTRFVLDSLVSQGMVRALGQARSQLYSIVQQHPLADAVTALFQQERGRWEDGMDALREAFKSRRDVRSAWLYGSVARGEDKPHSDVDLVVVVNENSLEVSQRVRDALLALGDTLSLHFSVVVLTPEELAALREDDPWWADVIRDAKVLKGHRPAKELARRALN